MANDHEVPSTGDPAPPDEGEPDLRGTLLLTTLLLIMIFGFWVLMYLNLIGG